MPIFVCTEKVLISSEIVSSRLIKICCHDFGKTMSAPCIHTYIYHSLNKKCLQ